MSIDSHQASNNKSIVLSLWWRHQMETFSVLLVLCARNSPAPVNSPHKGQWSGALMFSLICAWTNGCVSNRDAGDLRRYCAHYNVTVMLEADSWLYMASYYKTSRPKIWVLESVSIPSWNLACVSAAGLHGHPPRKFQMIHELLITHDNKLNWILIGWHIRMTLECLLIEPFITMTS